MSDDKGRAAGCFKFSCLGCATLIAVLVGFSLLLGALQMFGGQGTPEVENVTLSRPLPGSAHLTEAPDARTVAPLPSGVNPAVQAGRLELDLSMGEFILRPGPAGQPIQVEATYDKKSYELVEEFETEEDGQWTYKVRFGGRLGSLSALFGEEADNRVVITIPKDQPIALVGEIGIGENDSDLSGLWITEVDLDLGIGEHHLEFLDPPPEPMERFALNASIGELEVRGLGNASPREIDVNFNIGEVELDLGGEWQNDAEANLNFNIGEGRVRMPTTAHVEMERMSLAIGESQSDSPRHELPEGAPTVRLAVQGSIGEIDFSR